MWRPLFLSTLLRRLEQCPTAGLAFCGMEIIDDDDRPCDRRPTGLEGGPIAGLLHQPFETILRHMPMGTPCVLARKSAIEAVGGFDPSFRLCEDWDLWYRLARRFDFAYTLWPLTLCRRHPERTPMSSAAAWANRVRLNLKHWADAPDGPTRELLAGRLGRQAVLLLEQLLREGRGGRFRRNDSPEDEPRLLDEVRRRGLSPRGPRFRAGLALLRGPRWAGRAYALAVRAAGVLIQSLRSANSFAD